MKTLLTAAVLLSLFTLTFAPLQADPPVRKVTVVGNATVKTVPDEMHWIVAISINDASVAKAKARHDASLDGAIKYIKSLGSAVKDLQTGGIRIDKQTYFPPNTDKSKPFTVATQVTFTLTDFDKYGAIADALAKFDGVQVQSVDYATSKEDELEREALKQALLNATEKAKLLASTAGCYIDKPLDIQEGTENTPRPMMMRMNAAPGAYAGGTPTAVPGQIEIGGTVTATYDLYYK